MNKQPLNEELQKLYEALKASKAADYIVKINWDDWPTMLSVRDARGNEYKDRIVHIRVDDSNPEKFEYQALSNERLNDPEKYLTIETNEGVSTEEIIEVVYRLLAEWGEPRT